MCWNNFFRDELMMTYYGWKGAEKCIEMIELIAQNFQK